ncbi:MAG TPA: adenylate/guanylate cyclase domain-containing protein [Terriglobia bacterium]|nr:adenylate/guanylate cyclase domain-containing protein [Terriglobia bacterium]
MSSQQVEPSGGERLAVAESGSVPPPSGGAPASGRHRRRKRLRGALMAAAVLASAVLAWFLALASPLQLLELKTYDLRFVLRGSQPPPSGIVLVLIDAKTEAAYPEPHIFWHPHYADMLRAAALGGARAIGLDVSFALSVEPWAPDFDRQLAAAFAEVSATTPVVLAFDSTQPEAQNLPLYMLASAMGAMGFANVTLDADGFVRRQELLSGDDTAWESFSARLAAMTLNASWSRPQPEAAAPASRRNDSLLLGDRRVPLDSSGFLRIHFWGPAGTLPSVSMADAIAAYQRNDTAALERWFRDQVVLVGTLEPTDQHSTPFYLAGRGAPAEGGGTPGERQALTPGVEIQASTLATLLEERFLRDIAPFWEIALVLALAVLGSWCVVRLRFPLGPLLLGGMVLAYLSATVIALGQGIVLPAVAPALAAILSGFASYGAQALTEGRQKRLLQELFGRYVSPDVAKELLEYGEVPLGGTRQPVTVIFTDLRNYTSYCQAHDAQQVVEELNEYFKEMAAEIKAHGGMINKFIGDGIMALFGAPVPHPDDAFRAVCCGVRMVERNEEFNRRRAARGLEPLVIGVGIHTGPAVVGNIGAPEKMEYTAIGSAVNVASRIEGENKTFHTRLLISEDTYREVAGRVVAEEAGSARMKGIDKPMVLYKVVAIR